MPKPSNIRWRDKDAKEFNRVVRNFNNKIKRVSDKNPNTAEFLPEKVSVKTLKKEITTRQDFNRQLNSLKRFSRKGAEEIVIAPKGVPLTKFRIKEMQIKTRIVNLKRTIERKKLGFEEAKGIKGEIKRASLQPKKFGLNKTEKEFEKFEEALEKELLSNFRQIGLDKYKKNYIKGLTRFQASDALIKIVESMDDERLFNLTSTNPKLIISFMYEPQEMEDLESVIREELMKL